MFACCSLGPSVLGLPVGLAYFCCAVLGVDSLRNLITCCLSYVISCVCSSGSVSLIFTSVTVGMLLAGVFDLNSALNVGSYGDVGVNGGVIGMTLMSRCVPVTGGGVSLAMLALSVVGVSPVGSLFVNVNCTRAIVPGID